jgi:hypothetical protein
MIDVNKAYIDTSIEDDNRLFFANKFIIRKSTNNKKGKIKKLTI